MGIYNVTIGADPELFIINEKTGKVVSSIGLIPGEKGNPYRAEDMPKGFGLETDNILAEFNIPPCRTKDAFVRAITYMHDYIDKFVKNIDPKYGILCTASMTVGASQLKSKQAKLFGCDVDYNAYTQTPNPKPQGDKTNLRSAGGHIHIGYDNPNIDNSLKLIKYLDVYLGIPSVVRDPDVKRRSLYGKAGCFRLTNYGLEYRVLSSKMLDNVPNLEWVWNQLSKAIYACNEDYPLPTESTVISTINDSNVTKANELIKQYKI